jgi:uncharacterized phage-associated protein
MSYDARAIANFLLDYAQSEGQRVTIMQLLKILYFAHAWYLAKTGKPLIGQPFEAWKYGPVSRVVYEQFKDSGSRPIQSRANVLDISTAKYVPATYENLGDETSEFLRQVFRYYSRYHPYKLSDLTHEKGSPWETVCAEATRRAVPGMIISNDSIRAWFERTRQMLRSTADKGWTL